MTRLTVSRLAPGAGEMRHMPSLRGETEPSLVGSSPGQASAASRRSEAAAATLRQARRHVWCLQWLWPSSRSSSLSSWRHPGHQTVIRLTLVWLTKILCEKSLLLFFWIFNEDKKHFLLPKIIHVMARSWTSPMVLRFYFMNTDHSSKSIAV